MKNKKRVKINTNKTFLDLLHIQFLNDGAEQFEKAGARSQKEGRAKEMTYRFDMARCLRTAADWLDTSIGA